ncbi:MAG: hypothetical protein ISS47_07335 [Candidatus Omnitrophica bacterium]|nr:hypothetical protein [Candidatus Omnitrophota bacterium]
MARVTKPVSLSGYGNVKDKERLTLPKDDTGPPSPRLRRDFCEALAKQNIVTVND